MSAVRREGYTRIIPEPHPEAVAWWYVRDYGDGFVFARGGRTATSRKARSAIHQVAIQARGEHYEWERRPRFSLDRRGELVPLRLP